MASSSDGAERAAAAREADDDVAEQGQRDAHGHHDHLEGSDRRHHLLELREAGGEPVARLVADVHDHRVGTRPQLRQVGAQGRDPGTRRAGSRVAGRHAVGAVLVGIAADPDLGGVQAALDGPAGVGEDRLDPGLAAGLRHLLDRRPEAHLLGQPLALLGVAEGQPRLHHEHLQQLALVDRRDPVAGGQVDRHVAEQPAGRGVERGVERVLRVPGHRVVVRLEVGDPGRREPRVVHPAVRDEAQDAPPVGLPELVQDLRRRRPAAEDLASYVVGAGHRGHHQGVALEARDGGHAVAEDLADPVDDLLEDLGGVGGGVDPADELGEALEGGRGRRLVRPRRSHRGHGGLRRLLRRHG